VTSKAADQFGQPMLRIISETGGKLACRRDWLLHPHGCEARSAEQRVLAQMHRRGPRMRGLALDRKSVV